MEETNNTEKKNDDTDGQITYICFAGKGLQNHEISKFGLKKK